MAERALQIAPYPRHMTQILRLAVAQIEPGENAENLAGALRGERHVDLDELGGIESRIGLPASAHVAAEEGELDLLGHVHARVLQERSEIVGGRSHQRILEVENAEAGDLAAPRQPQQIGRMEVAQHPGRRRIDRRLQQLAPQLPERAAFGVGHRGGEPRQEPVQQ